VVRTLFKGTVLGVDEWEALCKDRNAYSISVLTEQGETIIITKNGTPVARISPQPSDRASDPEWQSAFAELERSLRSKPATGYRVGAITEDDKYGGDAA